jgi:outer membrane protein assembly factor BamB
MCRKIGKIGLMGLGLLLILLTGRPTMADDWPQWRGLERNGLSKEANWLNGWPAGQAPRVAWRAQVGRGHSAVSVSNGRAYTLGWDGQRETVFCFEAATGKLLWKQSYSSGDIVQWPGPRATPTVHKGTLYTLGQHGQLRAFDALTGKVRWSRQLPASYQPDPDYGFAWSPLVMEDLLLFSAGRKGLALYAADGRFAWGHDGQHGTCVSAVPFVHEGKHGVALLTNPDRESVWLVGVEPRTGTELWRHGPWREKWGAA